MAIKHLPVFAVAPMISLPDVYLGADSAKDGKADVPGTMAGEIDLVATQPE